MPQNGPSVTPDGFITHIDTGLLAGVTAELDRLAPDLEPRMWNDGGGVFGVLVAVGARRDILFGSDGPGSVWVGDLLDADGGYQDESITTDCPGTETDPARVAAALIAATRPYRDLPNAV
jgi:hypothetical protein